MIAERLQALRLMRVPERVFREHRAARRAKAIAARAYEVIDAGEQREGAALLGKAVALRPDSPTWRRDLLRLAASTGNRTLLYAHLTREMRAATPAAELASMLGELGQACRATKDWRGAADVFHDAHRTEPENDVWKKQYLQLRRYAPDWGFYSLDPSRAWKISDYRDSLEHGLVAPIRQLVFGWIPADSTDTRVNFKLNGTLLTDTTAVTEVTLPDGRVYLQFSRYLKDVWKYAGRGDRLTVECNGEVLPIIGRGGAFTFRAGQSRTDELFAELGRGAVFNKYGRLNSSPRHDQRWQTSMFDLYTKLRHDLSDAMGLTLIPFYGTMLGAVREQDFIGHDNDFDTIYISEHSSPAAVRQEFKDVCAHLLAKGYDLKVKPTHTWVKIPGTSAKLDIFFAWFNSADDFDISYGYHGVPVKRSTDFSEYQSGRLGTFEIPVPVNAEALLCQLYGPGWRTPDPGFAHYSTTRKIDRRYRLTTSDVSDLYWRQFYRDHHSSRASRFAKFVDSYFDESGALVEFGSGGGRDGIYFASQGWSMIGGDRSPEAVAQANALVKEGSDGLVARFEVVDVASAEGVTAFLEGNAAVLTRAEPLVVYMRFFLHAIDEPTQNTLLDAISGALDEAFYLCAEFRTVEDRSLSKVHGEHYRRYIEHDQLAADLRSRWGFEVEHLEAGQGLSPYDGEDPHLARIVARRPSRTAD
jgi:hypothetical protein